LKLKLLKDEGIDFTSEGKLIKPAGYEVYYQGEFDQEKGRKMLRAEVDRRNKAK
jgi:hypothetical protein